jgi:predicted RNase H-like nuclease (RuvC/YqgF family)
MKQSTDAYIDRLKAQLSATETALYKAKMSAQEVNTRKNLQIANQQLEIEALKDEVAEWKMSYENCHRMCSGYGMN